ncbi:MAG: ribose 5-phosphate isomerase A [Sarcina sp.]
MNSKKNAGYAAAKYIKNGMILGLGTGSTAFYLIEMVGELIKNGMNLKAVATSKETEDLAKKFSIPLLSINDVDKIDLAIDGVDELDSNFNAIKGGGGALFREKVVASFADEVIWIMDESKIADNILGSFPLPLEISPYNYRQILKKLNSYDYKPTLRKTSNNDIFITDNENYIVDLHLPIGFDIDVINKNTSSIVGVLETGLFLNMCSRAIIGNENSVEILENPNINIL